MGVVSFSLKCRNGIRVNLLLPSAEDICEWLDHSGGIELPELTDERFETLLTGDGPGPFEHAIWWVHPHDCPCDPETHNSSESMEEELCVAGRTSLLQVIEWVDDADVQDVVNAHLQVLTATYDHWWSGDEMLNDGLIGDACAGCLTDGPEHVARVGGEAERLSLELGEALAARHCSITTKQQRYV
jgi:hypothetical protein